MAPLGKSYSGNRVLAGSPHADFGRGSISTDNVSFLEQLLVFCKSKQMNKHNKGPQGCNGCRINSESVVDELCKLVQDNSYGKCMFCLLPTESLVLSVVQIMLDASQRADQLKQNSVADPSLVPNNGANDNHNPGPSFGNS